MNFKDKIISEMADAAAQKISRRVIVTLQRMKEPLLSGDDTELANVWDEVCAQVQGEESIYWDAYENTITQIIANEARELPEFVKQALWLQTDPGFDWAWDAENEEEPGVPPFSDEEIIDYILREYVLKKAEEWSNPRIRLHLERYF
jgi:hypothetical protein